MKFLDRAAAEPFRVFFPLGVTASIIGVLLWPAYFAGWIDTWPLEAHARWMVTGFGGCFIVGFLGTAGPRLLGSYPWGRFELLWHLGVALSMMLVLAISSVGAADLLAGFWLLGALLSLAARFFIGRQDVPPPGMPLALLGVMGAALSSFILSADGVLTVSPPLRQFCRLMLFQGFLWLPILGVAPYLLPRFFGRPSPHSFPESKSIPSGWWRPFLTSVIIGIVLIASFIIEVVWEQRVGMGLRAAITTGYLALTVPGWFGRSKVNGLGLALRWILPMAALGWILGAIFPPLRIANLHVMFVAGTGLLTLCVATRVILGHNERHDRLASPLKWMHGVWATGLLAASTRVIADYVPSIRISHFVYAAILWVLMVAFWGWKLRREGRLPELPEHRSDKRCPKPSRKRRSTPEAAPRSSP